MNNPARIVLSGALFLDENGERFFLLPHKATFGATEIRLIQDNFQVFPDDLRSGHVSGDVSVVGHVAKDEEKRMHDQLTEPSIVAEKIVPFQLIRERAFEIFQTGSERSAEENWLHAERELLGLPA